MPRQTPAVAGAHLPAVHRFLSDSRIAAFEGLVGRENVKRSIGAVLDRARRDGSNGAPSFEALTAQVLAGLQTMHADELVRVINGTGIILHTNLGRAPIAKSALEAVDRVASGYSNLEYDLESGERGSRYSRAVNLLREISGAEDALVVNNCGAAVLLVLDTFAKSHDVLIARSHAIEIGGGFRLPDVLARSGARLVEVGTVNKTRLSDYEKQLTAHSALLMLVHPSNFAITGFTESVDPKALVELGRRVGVPVVEDLGSGAVFDFSAYGLPADRTVRRAIDDGVDLVTFSGDKMLGGPQAGVIAGNSTMIARLRSNPLLRALRVDKITLAALVETVRLWTTPQRRKEIPIFAMLTATVKDLRERAARYVSQLGEGEIVETKAYAGGGTLPQSELDSIAVALAPKNGAAAAARALRGSDPPVVARIESDRLLLDLRTISPAEDSIVLNALRSL